jgi:hypothetical protein
MSQELDRGLRFESGKQKKTFASHAAPAPVLTTPAPRTITKSVAPNVGGMVDRSTDV